MSILSLEFILFTLGTVIVYYIVPLRVRWWVLLAASGVFYGLSGWQGSVWLVLVAAVTFLASLLQQKLRDRELKIAEAEDRIRRAQEEQGAAAQDMPDAAREQSPQPGPGEEPLTMREVWPIPDTQAEPIAEKGWFSSSRKVRKLRKLVLAIAIVLPFLAMAFTKYYDCLREWITSLPALSLILPLGLSYFTFQSVGYMVDVYRGKFPAERNPFKYLLFISFFPQMTQGPISPYPQLMPQLIEGHRFDPDNFVMGAQLALWGFFKKMILADTLAYVTAKISVRQPGWFILLTVIIYAVRLYADFSGGMDVIRGAARMVGVDMVENFRRPFFSFSVAEYWRRWHISLGVWFRSYLFYPLSTSEFGLVLSRFGRKVFGKKAGRAFPATVANIIIFFLIGIWHTANGNAVIFGLYFGLVLGIELLLDPAFRKLKKKLHIQDKKIWWRIFCLVRTWILILIPQYFAFTEGPSTAFKLLKGTFMNWSFKNAQSQFTSVMYRQSWWVAAGAFAVVLVVDLICEKVPDLNRKLAQGKFFIRWPVMIAMILAILVFGCYGSGYDATAFLYTHF